MHHASLVLCLLLSLTLSLPAATLTVDLEGGAGYTDIQSAIDAAADGDTVLVKPGEYVITEPINFNRLHDPADPQSPPAKNIVLQSQAGAKQSILRMSETPTDPDTASVVIFETGETGASVVHGFTLTGGTGKHYKGSWSGGGAYCSESSPTITNCTIQANSATGGGGVYCAGGSPTLNNCTIVGNSAVYGGVGGGVYCAGGSPTLTNCTIVGNSAAYGGGMGCAGGSPTLTNCTISGNSAAYGGGVCCEEGSSPTLANCIVWDNAGGSLQLHSPSQPEVSFSCVQAEGIWPGTGNTNADPFFCGFAGPPETFVGAASAEWGDGTAERPFRDLAAALAYSLSLKANSPCIGAGQDGANMGADLGSCEAEEPSAPVVVRLAPGRYRVEGLTLVHGPSILGAGADETVLEGTVWGLSTGATLARVTVTGGTMGGIVISSGERPMIEDCTISGNSTDWVGGVYCYASSPTLVNCTISGNSGGHDGVVCGSNSSPTLTNCTISGNSGGGVYCIRESSPTLVNCTISGNSGGHGGVFCWEASPTLTNCTISGNSGGQGGVVCENSSPTLTNCTISGNSTRVWGGGVCCEFGSSPTLTNCTIVGNSAAYGGGVSCRESSSPTLTNCTISGNSATSGDGGGVSCRESSSPTLTNCIVWDNAPDSACGALRHCLTDKDPLFVRPGEWVDCASAEDPGCVAFQWDPETGAPTAWHRWVPGDYHLQSGSPCIDAGTSEGAPTTDIEGHARPCGAGVDIGAYEFGDCRSPVRFPRGDSNADGHFDISDPVAALGLLFLGGVALPCLDAADADDSGTVDITDAVYSLNFLFLGGEAILEPFPGCGTDPTDDALGCEGFAACP